MTPPEPPDRATIQAYLRRIGYEGDAVPDLTTLTAIHRRHLLSIPYDALDIQLGRPVTLDPRDAFRKLVAGRRGGWCYEMNGLLAWILDGIGFRVLRMGGTVMRADDDPEGRGNHLVLLVGLDRPYVADVGFGEGPQEPFALAAGRFEQQGSTFLLDSLDGGWWRLSNETMTDAPPFDFQAVPADIRRMEATNRWLQRDPESPFVLNAVVARGIPRGFEILRGRVLTTVRPPTSTERVLGSATEYRATLLERFGIDLPEAEDLWPRIVARHELLFGPEGTAPNR